jgi:hypothetical protein
VGTPAGRPSTGADAGLGTQMKFRVFAIVDFEEARRLTGKIDRDDASIPGNASGLDRCRCPG